MHKRRRGQNGLGAAQQHHEAGQSGKAHNGQHHANGQSSKKAGGSKAGGGIGVPAAKLRLMMVPEPWPSVKPSA